MKAESHRLTGFKKAVTGNTYLVDRTPYIEKYECANDPFVICLRPRGFDKPLLLSMLRYYYARELIKTSEKLFSNFYISSHVTALRSKFSIFYLDFCSIASCAPKAVQAEYQKAFARAIEEYCITENTPLRLPLSNHPLDLLKEFLIHYGSKKLFVLINEYDGFQYEILDPELNRFDSDRIGKNPIIKNIYNELKQALHSGLAGRIFVAGMDDTQDRSR